MLSSPHLSKLVVCIATNDISHMESVKANKWDAKKLLIAGVYMALNFRYTMYIVLRYIENVEIDMKTSSGVFSCDHKQ